MKALPVVRVKYGNVLQTTGTSTITGSVLALNSNNEFPGMAILLPTGWLQIGDGLDLSVIYEFGGVSATNRNISFVLQPAADIGTTNNISPFLTFTTATATPQDGTSYAPHVVLGSGIKRSIVGLPLTIGLNTTVFASITYDPAVSYRVFATCRELADAANSVIVYRMGFTRSRNGQ